MVEALRKLPGRQREAIVLRYYADFSEAEVAAAMGISCGAVKSHTARAMAALRADLEQQDRAWKPDSRSAAPAPSISPLRSERPGPAVAAPAAAARQASTSPRCAYRISGHTPATSRRHDPSSASSPWLAALSESSGGSALSSHQTTLPVGFSVRYQAQRVLSAAIRHNPRPPSS